MKVTDPVCGARLSLENVIAQEDYEGWAYFFCSTDCHRRFRASPEGFSQKAKTAPFDNGLCEGRHPRRVRCQEV